jgi:hypothetical protein
VTAKIYFDVLGVLDLNAKSIDGCSKEASPRNFGDCSELTYMVLEGFSVKLFKYIAER